MIKAVITDFDGTLVDTFEANLRAYQRAFQSVGLDISEEKYKQCFGFRFERLMSANGIFDDNVASIIKEKKKIYYPKYFEFLRPNKSLINLISSFKFLGCRTAIASTARRENLLNAVDFLGLRNLFDIIFAGVDVKQGKPSPEIYLRTMEALDVLPSETLIFEDSSVGIEAAKASGANYMIVDPRQFD